MKKLGFFAAIAAMPGMGGTVGSRPRMASSGICQSRHDRYIDLLYRRDGVRRYQVGEVSVLARNLRKAIGKLGRAGAGLIVPETIAIFPPPY